MEQKLTSPLIHIGASESAVLAARAAIMEILVSQNSEKVKSNALAALVAICRVENTTISNCNIGIPVGDAR